MYNCTPEGRGRRPAARRSDGLRWFFFTGVPEETGTFTPAWMRSLCENGKYGGAAVIGGHWSIEPGRLGPTSSPGGEHPAVRLDGPVLGPEPSAVRPTDASARTTRRTRSSGPPDDRARSHRSERSAGHSLFGWRTLLRCVSGHHIYLSVGHMGWYVSNTRVHD
jgi:hypothetical protein